MLALCLAIRLVVVMLLQKGMTEAFVIRYICKAVKKRMVLKKNVGTAKLTHLRCSALENDTGSGRHNKRCSRNMCCNSTQQLIFATEDEN